MKPKHCLAVFWLVIGLIAAVVGGQALHTAASPSGDVILRRALEQARDAGSYRVSIDVQQTVYMPRPALGGAIPPAEQSARISVEGIVNGPRQARFALREGEIRGRTPQSNALQPADAREVLISGEEIYQRQGDQWVLQDNLASAPGLTSDALMLLSVARNARRAEPIQTLGGTFERVSFTLDSDDVLTFMLQQLGRLDEWTAAQVRLNGIRYGGTGELWIDRSGFPARLALNLTLERGGREPFRAYAVSTALYSSFGEKFPAEWLDPTIAPLSHLSTSPIPGSGLTDRQLQRAGIAVVALAVVLAMYPFLLRGARLSRRIYAPIALMLIVTLLAPGIAQAAAPQRLRHETEERSAIENMVANMHRIGEQREARIAALASTLPDKGDQDGDGLPNGYELKLGTNPFARDSDLDGLSDGKEVRGFPCKLDEDTSYNVETDPLNPDSNYDGLRDGDEFDRGQCRFGSGSRPYPWDDDNDGDGVPDGLDLSPFTKSDKLGEPNGANMTFELVHGSPFAMREMQYFEVQVVPVNYGTLQYAYKSALEWPVDDKGLIQHNPITTTGDLRLAPFLQVRVEEDDLPSIRAMSQYGISVTQVTTGVFDMVIPLAPVERGGRVYAFQAKVFQDRHEQDNVIRWRDMRLKWALQGDVLRPDESGQMVRSETGSYGLVVYDEPYYITGVQASRQAGASSIVAGAKPKPGQPLGAGPAALLRAGLEAQFLSGRLSLTDIYNRFNYPSAATITETWGITQSFKVSPPQEFHHLDEMLLTTNVTTTRSILNSLYPSHAYTPTLVIATEQRTAALNVDELYEPDLADLTLTLCLKQIATSRTLKLATYRWDPTASSLLIADDWLSPSAARSRPLSPTSGDWRMLSLDEVLQYVQAEFNEIYGTAEEFYEDSLTILQMAMTVWYQGQTALQSIGGIDLTHITDALSDPNFYLSILDLLDKYGFSLPHELRQVVEFLLGVIGYPGGPLKWLEDQWNSLVAFGEGVIGGFKDFAAGSGFSPDSLIGFTQTAINVLTWLASVFDLGVLGDVVKVLYRLLEIFQKIQELWDAIQFVATQGTQMVGEALNAALSELSSASGSMQVLGLIFTIASTLFSMFMQIASGNLSVLGVIGVILQAVVQIAIAIVLFVVGSIFPVGTVIAIAYALVKLITGFLQDYLGVVGQVIAVILDPIGAFLDAVNPDPEPLVEFFGSPQFSEMRFLTFPDQPLGGFAAGDSFGLAITGTVSMYGDSDALDHSRAWMQLGRFGSGDKFRVCGEAISQYLGTLSGLGPIDQQLKFEGRSADEGCIEYSLRLTSETWWRYERHEQHISSGVYDVDGNAVRTFTTIASMNVAPDYPRVNGRVSADISFNVKEIWENCGIFGLDCDVYPERYETPPSLNYLYFDILPRTVVDVWRWDSLINRDPDGDGLIGNPDHQVDGPDNNLCNNPSSHEILDSDPGYWGNDGLSDYFELFDNGSSPCKWDTDDDGLHDGQEFMMGTDPNKADTDGDGLKDGEEVARWIPGNNVLAIPWRVRMNGAYPGLPDPIAFPNPRLANADRDGRSDKKEKEFFSSPNGFNLGEMYVAISQDLVWGGGTRIHITSMRWPNDAAPAISPVLTITLPITFTGVTRAARVMGKGTLVNPTGTPIADTPPNVYAWKLPPISLNGLISATLTGLPAVIPAGVVSVTVELSYREAGVARYTSSVEPLLINRGGPDTAILSPVNDDILSALNKPIRIQGVANDPEGPGIVQVCVRTTPPCSTADWKNAVVGSLYAAGWYYDWAPPADGTYSVFARAWDIYGVAGPVTGPVVVNVDSTPPSGATFDLGPIAYISTTFSPETLAAFTITGRITDGVGAAYVSGAGNAEVLAVSDTDQHLRGESVLASPGAASSAFSARFSLPSVPFNGDASPSAQGMYLMQLSARDRAGNVLVNGDSLFVLVDDTPPFVYVRVPQVISTTEFELGGRADDTALDLRRTQSGQQPYPISQTLTMRDTQFSTRGRVYIVGDLNGDTLDDVVNIVRPSGEPLQAGIFFGRVTGFPSTLNLDQADVTITGEADFAGPYTYGPAVAINAPGLFDVNGDSIGDLLIGDPNVNSAQGRAYVLLGRRTWPATISLSNADWRLSVSGATFFGGSVASAGDVDGDGLSDVLVGAASEGAGYEIVSLYLGRERGVPARQSRLYVCAGSCPSPLMPNLAGLGDMDGDGLSDFLLASSGGVWLIPGRSQKEWPASGAAQSNSTGLLVGNGQQQTVAPAGDVNGDGLRDMLIGDPLATTSRVFVVFGRRPENPFPVPPAPFILTTNADISFKETVGPVRLVLGKGLAPMGDLDRDGKDDYAFSYYGAAIAISSRTPRLRDMSPLSATNFIHGTQLAQLAGDYLSSGDINGDAIRDVMVGAPGAGAAYLFNGNPPPLTPSGVKRVEIGIAGPIIEPSLPYTATLPEAWGGARLGISSNGIRPFSFTLSFREDGDYRIYARAIDYAGNRLSDEAWYVGNVWVNTDANPIPTLTSVLDMPSLYRQGYLHVKMSGTIASDEPIQHLRIFDGERWTRMPLSTGAPGYWANESNIERSDRRLITFRAVARDAFGNSAHDFQRVTTDTLVARPVLNANLPANDWFTNITPTLVITWNPVLDAGGPVTIYATIDTITKTVPTTLVTTNQVTRTLDAPGAWYAHVRVVDSAGNQRFAHDGPYVVNRSQTPSAILPDGWLDFYGGEYVEGTMTSYDPYAATKPVLLLATWNESKLYLGLTGSDWNPNKQLAVYLDTRPGGSDRSLGNLTPDGEPTHKLPFAADYALVVSSTTTYTLYSNTGAGWVISPTTTTWAITDDDTEIVFDRPGLGISETSPVSLLAYVTTNNGIAAVIPASARMTTTKVISGPTVFVDSIHWPSLGNGYPATLSDLPTQWIAPLVSIHPGYDTQLIPNELVTMTIHIVNPDILPYDNHPMTVTLGSPSPQLMRFVGVVSGAGCISCPPNGREWVLRVTVGRESYRDVVLRARALLPPATGVFTVPVSAALAHQGLPASPQPPATTAYAIDNSVGRARFSSTGPTIFAQPGAFKLPLLTSLANPFLGCKQQLSINKGAGFQALGMLGSVISITDTLPVGYNQLWTLKVTADNGQVSTDTVVVQTDDHAPQVQISVVPVLTGSVSLLTGLASDDLALGEVQVSMNGGPFQTAVLEYQTATLMIGLQATVTGLVTWTLPINANGMDGERVQFVARAVDAAGNIGPNSLPVTVTLDTTGPVVTVTQSLTVVSGLVSDGSGVAQVQVSLDGGVSYQPATLVGDEWSFNRSEWTGGAPIEWVVIRALDIYGNVSQYVAPGEGRPYRVYLPVILRATGDSHLR